MICPECGEENKDSAKFCKTCGTSLNPVATMKKTNSDESRPIKAGIFNFNDNSSPSSFEATKSGGDNKNLIIICLTILICAVLIAGGMIFLNSNGTDDNSGSDMASSISLPNSSVDQSDDSQNKTASVSQDDGKSRLSDMRILSGSFYTGSSGSDKTYCSVYVGRQYSGESVKISVLYSRDGSNLNKGNIVPKTVDSDGYVSVPSADAFKYYPDHALISIYDSNGNVLDTQEVNMSPHDGTQNF